MSWGGLGRPRRDQEHRPGPERLIAPGGAGNIVRARRVIVTGPNGGEFVYDSTGNLRSASVGQTTTDPLQGLTCPQGISTWNGHGAIVTLLSTANAKGAFFQYFDNQSAAQGALILAVASVASTDPVNGTAYTAGLTGIDTVFSDSINVVGSVIQFIISTFTQNGRLQPTVGSVGNRPFLILESPEQGTSGHLAMLVQGASPDGTNPSQWLIANEPTGFTAPTPTTKALAEIQGSGVVTGGVWAKSATASGSPPAGAETWQDLGSTGLAGDAGSASYRMTAEGELQISVHKSFTALGALTTATFANALPAAYRPPAARVTGGDPIAVNPGTPVAGTRLTVNNATGVVQLVNLPTGATVAGCDVRIPLI